jgi:hypothetical protein
MASRGATPTKTSVITLRAVVATLTFWAFARMKIVSNFFIYIEMNVLVLQVIQWYYLGVTSYSWSVNQGYEKAEFAYQSYVILVPMPAILL